MVFTGKAHVLGQISGLLGLILDSCFNHLSRNCCFYYIKESKEKVATETKKSKSIMSKFKFGSVILLGHLIGS